ncbi:MAG: pilin [bacterium]
MISVKTKILIYLIFLVSFFSFTHQSVAAQDYCIGWLANKNTITCLGVSHYKDCQPVSNSLTKYKAIIPWGSESQPTPTLPKDFHLLTSNIYSDATKCNTAIASINTKGFCVHHKKNRCISKHIDSPADCSKSNPTNYKTYKECYDILTGKTKTTCTKHADCVGGRFCLLSKCYAITDLHIHTDKKCKTDKDCTFDSKPGVCKSMYSLGSTAFSAGKSPNVPDVYQSYCFLLDPVVTPIKKTITWKSKIPDISIRIPGLTFASIQDSITLDDDGRKIINIPWVGQYITAVYKFALALASVVAVVMLIIQGVTIMMSGGGEAKQGAYKKILQIFVGLGIMWGSYAILYNINPDLVKFKALAVTMVEKEEAKFESDSVNLGTGSAAGSSAAGASGPSYSSSKNKYIIPSYKQWKGAWAKETLPMSSSKMSSKGCVFVSYAIALQALYNDGTNPSSLKKLYTDAKQGDNVNIDLYYQKDFMKNRYPGLKVTRMKRPAKISDFTSALDQGKLIAVRVYTSAFTGGGHQFVIYDYYEKGGKYYVKVSDPGTGDSAYTRCTKDMSGKYAKDDAKIKDKLKKDRDLSEQGKTSGFLCGDPYKLSLQSRCQNTNCAGPKGVAFGPNNYPLEYIMRVGVMMKDSFVFERTN